jgi:hypothetical protein
MITFYPKRGSEIFSFDSILDLPVPPIGFTFATTLDTDNLYVWDANSSAWKVIAGPNTTFGGITQLFGDVTATGPGVAGATIADEAVTLAKIENATGSAKLLGSGASGAGASYSEITLGTNLSMSGTTLNASGGGGGSPGGSDTQIQFNDAGSFGGDAQFTFNKTTNVVSIGAEAATGTVRSRHITRQCDRLISRVGSR